ncbi:UNVERIFIED_CONTAM: hypothetical protein HDU68_007569 [Siphonaria sp. JEL0065]|nr:hypothetical protein HDU68_007569 [Siphonaria sp. JEL0065]
MLPLLLQAAVQETVHRDPLAIALIYLSQSNEQDLASSPSVQGQKSFVSGFIIQKWTRIQIWNIAVRWAADISKNVARSKKDGLVTVAIGVSDGQFLPILHLASILCHPAIALVPIDLLDPRLPLILEDANPSLYVLSREDDVCIVHEAAPKIADSIVSSRILAVPVLLLSDLVKLDCSASTHSHNWVEYLASDISHIYFTSGSTGRPKGCISSLGALSAYCIHAKPDSHQTSEASVVFIASSHTFDPSLGDHLSSLFTGSIIARATRSLVTTSLSTCLELTGATHICTNPSLFDTVSNIAPTLQVVALGGEPMGTEVVQKCMQKGIRLLNTYGVTECAVYQMCFDVTATGNRKYMGTGGMKGNEVYLMVPNAENSIVSDDTALSVNPKDMTRVTNQIVRDSIKKGKDVVGEIWIGGPQVGEGYLNRPELSKARFVNHPQLGKVFRTGDLAKAVSMSQEGGDLRAAFDFGGEGGSKAALVFVGRSDTQIKVNGQRVEVEEVEQSLLSSTKPLLNSIAVVWNKESNMLVCYTVPSSITRYLSADSEVSRTTTKILTKLLSHISEATLPRHMIPSKFILLRELPFTPTGKISRTDLSSRPITLLEYSEFSSDEDESESDEFTVSWESFVSSAWRSVLGFGDELKLSRSVKFAELGGDSLKALAVCKKLNDALVEAGAVATVGNSIDDDQNVDEVDKVDGKLEKQATIAVKGGNGFGQLLGVLAPAELIKRPQLKEFAKYLSQSYADFVPTSLSPQNDKNQQVSKPKPTNKSPAPTATRSNNTINTSASDIVISLLFSSAASNLTDITLFLVKTLKAKVNGTTATTKTTTPLHIACINSNEQVAKVLLECGALATTTDGTGANSIHLASQHGPVSLVRLLVYGPTGEPPASTNSAGRSKRKGATATSNSIISLLLTTDDNGQSPLHHASRAGAPNSVLEFLIDTVGVQNEKRILDQKDSWGRTALHWASVNGHGGAVKVLVGRGADLKVKDLDGEDALEIAERRARCGEALRGGGLRSSLFGDIAKILGGSGGTKNVSKFLAK